MTNSRLHECYSLEDLYGQVGEPAAMLDITDRAVAGSPVSKLRHYPPMWPAARTARLRVLVDEGEMSFGEIALDLGVTRNAVIGKHNRMGLSGVPAKKRVRMALPPKPVPKPPAPVWRPQPRPEPSKGASPEPSPEPPMPQETSSATAVDFLGLTERSCRFPLWDHTSHVPFYDQMYCGAVALDRRPYCGACTRKAFGLSPGEARWR